MKYLERSAKILAFPILLALLYFCSLYSYRLFLAIAVIFSICVETAVFIITWNSRRYIKNNYLIIIGIASLHICVMQFIYLMSYSGVSPESESFGSQVWIAMRSVESTVLLASFLSVGLKKNVRISMLLAIFTFLTAGHLLSIFVWRIFPVCYAEGVGFTPFKIGCEFLICSALLAAILVLRIHKDKFDGKIYILLFTSLLSAVLSNLCFAANAGLYGPMNIMGHYFEMISYFFVYLAIVRTGVKEPYNLIFREISLTAQKLFEQNQVLSSKTITDSRTMKEYLDLLQRQYSTLNRQAKLLDLSSEAIFAWEMDGPIVYWNQGAEKIYGYTANDAIGHIPHILLKPQVPGGGEQVKASLLEKGSWTGYAEQTSKDGRVRIIETRMQVIPNQSGADTVLETNRDVTEKIGVENEMKKNTAALKNIINSTDDFIWSVDIDYRIIHFNQAFFDLIQKNYDLALAPGLPFLDCLPPQEAAAYREMLDRVKNDGDYTVDMRSFRGEKYISFSFHQVNLNAKLIEITVFGRDMTERIKAEQEIIHLNSSLEARIDERTKDLRESLDTIRSLTMLITHDLKAPLYEISVYAGLLQKKAGCDETAGKIIRLCTDMSTMINDLIEYDRLSSTAIQSEILDMRKLIEDVFRNLKTENAVLVYQTGMPSICADKVMMQRVVTNLLSNALKFSAMRQVPRITVGCRKEEENYVFYIKDNGIGIDMTYADKLFNVFERLHSAAEFEGHGLGLASVRSIIQKHGGKTWIKGKVNNGVTVFFSLPATLQEDA
jgi:PAS domain S-box-containing protein